MLNEEIAEGILPEDLKKLMQEFEALEFGKICLNNHEELWLPDELQDEEGEERVKAAVSDCVHRTIGNVGCIHNHGEVRGTGARLAQNVLLDLSKSLRENNMFPDIQNTIELHRYLIFVLDRIKQFGYRAYLREGIGSEVKSFQMKLYQTNNAFPDDPKLPTDIINLAGSVIAGWQINGNENQPQWNDTFNALKFRSSIWEKSTFDKIKKEFQKCLDESGK